MIPIRSVRNVGLICNQQIECVINNSNCVNSTCQCNDDFTSSSTKKECLPCEYLDNLKVTLTATIFSLRLQWQVVYFLIVSKMFSARNSTVFVQTASAFVKIIASNTMVSV